jgi:D-alanyl-D-alanine carboxypeptidase (penicillin-binding protein 5/6)
VTGIRRTLALAALMAVLVPASAAAQPAPPPHVPGAQAAIVVDAVDGTVMFAKRPDAERSIASTTKLMTALLALEQAAPDQVFTAPAYSAAPAESRINLREGERMTVEDLLEALLLESANDAAHTLAVRSSGSVTAFVEAMNREARAMGLTHTHFANPIGLDDPENRSSALDLAVLARRILQNDFLAATVDMPRARLTTGARTRIIANRNRLIAREPFMTGVKTGHTQGAGYVLVGSATRKGARLVSVVLGAPSEGARDADTLALMRYGFSQYRRTPVARPGATLARAKVEHFGDRETPLVARRRASVTVRRGERLRTVLEAPGTVSGPLEEGTRVGTMRVYSGDRLLRTVPLVTGEAVPEAGFIRKAWGLLVPAAMVLAGLAIWLAVRRRKAGRVELRRPARAE